MPDTSNEPSLTPSGDGPKEKAEKVRAGKGVVGILGGIAVAFLFVFVGIVGYAVIFGFSH